MYILFILGERCGEPGLPSPPWISTTDKGVFVKLPVCLVMVVGIAAAIKLLSDFVLSGICLFIYYYLGGRGGDRWGGKGGVGGREGALAELPPSPGSTTDNGVLFGY